MSKSLLTTIFALLWIFGVALQKTFWWGLLCFVLPPVAWILAAKWAIARWLVA